VQGQYELPTEGQIASPFIGDFLSEPKELQLSYWKAVTGPSLDICLQDTSMKRTSELNCVDSIQVRLNSITQQLIHLFRDQASSNGSGDPLICPNPICLSGYTLGLADYTDNFEKRTYSLVQIVLRARQILSAEDIIGVDDVRLIFPRNADAYVESPLPRMYLEYLYHVLTHPYAPGTSQQQQELVPFHQGQGMHKGYESFQGYDSYLRPKVASNNEQPLQLPKYNKLPPKVYSPHPVAPHNIFPEFPSFSDGLSPNLELKRPPNFAHPPQSPGIEQISAQASQSCKAVRCSFLTDTCLWYPFVPYSISTSIICLYAYRNLGPAWKQPAVTGSKTLPDCC